MKKFRNINSTIMLLVMTIVLLFGCRNGDGGLLGSDNSSTETVRYLIISPTSSTIVTGASQNYSAALFENGKFIEDVTDDAAWSASDNENVTFDKPGVAKSSYSGEVTISAMYDGLTSNVSTLVIEDKTIKSLYIVPQEQTSIIGVDVKYQAIASFENGGSEDVTDVSSWTTGNNSIAEGKGNGIITPIALGDTQVKTAYDGLTATATLHVVGDITQAESLVVTPQTSLIHLGNTVQLTATLQLSDGNKIDVTNSSEWSSELPGTMISGSGMFYSQSTGESKVIATLGNLSDSGTVTIDKPSDPILVVSPDGLTVVTGVQGTYSAELQYPEIGESYDVTRMSQWTSSDKSVISISGFGDTGGDAISLNNGSSQICATFGEYNDCVVTVVSSDYVVKSLELTPNEQTVKVGNLATFKAVLRFEGESNVEQDDLYLDVTDSVSWSITDETIAERTGDTLVAKGKSVGTTRIEVVYNNELTANATLNVIDAEDAFTYIIQVVDEEITDESNPAYWQSIPVGAREYDTELDLYYTYPINIYSYKVTLDNNGTPVFREPFNCDFSIDMNNEIFMTDNIDNNVAPLPVVSDLFFYTDSGIGIDTSTYYDDGLFSKGGVLPGYQGHSFRIRGVTQCGTILIPWLTKSINTGTAG